MRRAVAAGVACAVVALVVAGCTGDDPEMPGLTASPTTEPTPTTTPTPTSVAGTVADLSDPELGIVFEELPELTGDEADVYNWLATFELEYWRTLVTSTASPGFAAFTSPEVQADMAQLASANTEQGLEFGGVFHARIGDIAVDGDSATGTTCDDYRDVTIAGPEGPRTLEEEGADVPILSEVTLARHPDVPGTWMIVASEGAGHC